METWFILRGWKITSVGKVAFISFKIKRPISNGTLSNKFRTLMNWSSISWKEQLLWRIWVTLDCLCSDVTALSAPELEQSVCCDTEGFAFTLGQRIQPISLTVGNTQWISLLLRFNISLSILVRKSIKPVRLIFLNLEGVVFHQLSFPCTEASLAAA